MPDLSKLNFFSDVNYMKRHSSTSHQSISVAAFSTGSLPPITHGQNFIPQFEVYGDLDNDGTLWARNKLYVAMENAATTPTSPQISAWIDERDLTIQVYNPTASTKVVPVYYVIYQDYGTTTN